MVQTTKHFGIAAAKSQALPHRRGTAVPAPRDSAETHGPFVTPDSSCKSGWEALRGDPLPWLLEEHRPNLHWRVLVELVGRPVDSPAVCRARGGASAAQPVATLLEDLQPDGSWATAISPWRRYSGPGWRFVAAVAWGADPTDPRLGAAARRFLEESPGEGGFSIGRGQPPSPVVTARLVQALTVLGFGGHLRVQEALAWFEEESSAWPDREPARAVVAAALLPAVVAVRPRRLALERRLIDQVRAAVGCGYRAFSILGFPNLGRTDFGELLWALACGGTPYARWMQDPLACLQRLQRDGGRWHRRRPRPASLPVPTDTRGLPGQPCRWITLRAVVALNAYAVDAGLPRLFPQRRG